MAKKQKPNRPKARLPRGFGDRPPTEIRATNQMVEKIREVYERYGFDPIETPFLEFTDAMGKFLPDTDRPNAGVFSLQDEDDQWMSLRYDLTAPLARHVAENFNQIQMPYRTYRQGWVFRNEKPGPGRFRQFMQFDADSVGAPGVQADAEMCMMMADTMEALGIKRGDYVIRVNNRKVLDGVLEAIGVTDEAQKLSVLRAIDKADKFGIEGVKLLLGKGRKDESGDFTEGAGLDEGQADTVLSYLNGTETVKGGGSDELSALSELLQGAGYDIDRVCIDPSCVRGLEYYTGMVYEAELTFDVTNEKGVKVQFGSVGGGGRYDGLVSRFTGQPVPATGFSIGVSRLMTALTNLGKLGQDEMPGPVVVCVMDKDPESLAGYQQMVQELRQAGIRAEMYQGNPKNFGKQLQYADKRNSPAAIIQGSDEREKGIIQIKDLHEGKRAAAAIKDNAEWKSERPGQFECDRGQLVEKVKELSAVKNWLTTKIEQAK
ncbi:MAG TPA: histidine--tRNA ligase [Devosia sp.]|nr:histidine--tRNA ligase [Devosia sp.]